MGVDPAVIRHLRDLEEQILGRDVRSSRERLDALIEDRFVEIASDGRVYDKTTVIEALLGEKVHVVRTITDFETILLAPGVVLATYRVIRRVEPPTESLRSSVWRRAERDGSWRLVFHQGTPATSE